MDKSRFPSFAFFFTLKLATRFHVAFVSGVLKLGFLYDFGDFGYHSITPCKNFLFLDWIILFILQPDISSFSRN